MTKFCTKCGKPLNENGKCDTCPTSNVFSKLNRVLSLLLSKMGLNNPFDSDLFTANEPIVPNSIKANEGEVPVKEYRVATLRSRIRGQFAKGKLMVTNKRLIFRAPGLSYTGGLVVQHEFNLADVAGVEVKKSNRISPLNVILSIILVSIVSPFFAGIFRSIADRTAVVGLLLSIFFGVACMLPFFVFKKKFWLKLLLTSCGFGAVLGTGKLTSITQMSFLFGINLNVADFVSVVVLIIWLLNMIFVALVPDLVMIVKTEGASEAITIRRKRFATLFNKQEMEYTGFSEVLPDKDIDAFINEIGALIHDIQTLGDMGVEKWQQNDM